MNLDAAKIALDRLVDNASMFQLTGDGHGSFTLDVKSQNLARQTYLELLDKGHNVSILLDGPIFTRIH